MRLARTFGLRMEGDHKRRLNLLMLIGRSIIRASIFTVQVFLPVTCICGTRNFIVIRNN